MIGTYIDYSTNLHELKKKCFIVNFFNLLFFYLFSNSDTPVNLSDSDDDEIDNLVYKFQKISTKEGSYRICQPKHEQKVNIDCYAFFLFISVNSPKHQRLQLSFV